MRSLTVVGLAAGCCLASFLPANSFADNSNAVSDITCRVALEGTAFNEVSETNPADRCCYVLEEAEWYNTHDVLLQRWYQRQDDDHVYFTVECGSEARQSAASSAAAGDQSNGGNGSQGDTDGGKVSASSAMMSSSEGAHLSSSSENGNHGHPSSSSSLPLSSSGSEPSELPGNPGNAKPVGGAGEAPNGDVSGFKPEPGTEGKSN